MLSLSSGFPYIICGKFSFLFYQCSIGFPCMVQILYLMA
jgi:hypothetical protein